MAAQYIYSDDNAALDNTVLVEEDVVWEQEDCDEDTSHYSDTVNVTLTDNINESYTTAHDSENESHYFSVLDNTHEVSLSDIGHMSFSTKIEEDHNETLENEMTDESTPTVDIGGQQVVLFRIDGSDDLYGLQVAQDEDGNLQKFQFKIRQNEDGNLEAIPETIQLSPFDCDISQLASIDSVPEESASDLKDKEELDNLFIKQEYTSDNMLESFQKDIHDQDIDEETFTYEEDLDTKSGILETHFEEQFEMSPRSNEDVAEEDEDEEEECELQINENPTIIDNIPDETPAELEDMYEPNVEIQEVSEKDDEYNNDHIEQLFVKEDHIIGENSETDFRNFFNESEESPSSHEYEGESESESDNEDYEMVNGLHVTADADADADADDNSDSNQSNGHIEIQPLQTHVYKLREQTSVKNAMRNLKIRNVLNLSGNNAKTVIPRKFLLLNNFEKENVANNIKANPRSILKSSQPLISPCVQEKATDEEKFEKRFAKSKEAIRAKLFQNFIAQTKIIHAPVRQERLPRKQTITPVARTDEEIIVQEVFVSSNGYVETTEDGVLKERVLLKTNETIQLSDTDEDYDPRKPHKVKRKTKKRKSLIEITITDSESEESIVDIVLSDSDEEPNKVQKKRRGRPPKNKSTEDEAEKTGEIPVKRGRGRPPKVNKSPKETVTESTDEEAADLETDVGSASPRSAARKRRFSKTIETSNATVVEKAVNKCTKCPKTFPSVGSLKTHMQYHSFKESNIRNWRESQRTKREEAKYKCSQCSETFKNNMMLARHLTTHKSMGAFECSICKLKFSEKQQLGAHRRSHVKEQMFKTTTIPKVSPKKMIPRVPPRGQIKCLDCKRVFTSAAELTAHSKLHVRYACVTCQASFLSKLMLDNHVRRNCVKPKRSPQKMRLSFNARKSFINVPQRSVTKMSVPPLRRCLKPITAPNATKSNNDPSIMKPPQAEALIKKPANASKSLVHLQCDLCKITFSTYTGLFKHKVLEHGYETPDKSIVKAIPRKSLYRPKAEHAGVPASEKLRTAFANLRRKLEK